ncbi:hypothetical protein OEZ86_009089 [Tetradesmus obliquus]|nr:hypothetical protein OEZ86_009089 [Tetradesmus obliquus]
MKQRARKQQQQQQALDAAQQAGLAPLTPGQLAALYADPAARYYAAGFAARQTAAYGTGLRANAALRSPHLVHSHSLWRAVSGDRMQLVMGPQGSSSSSGTRCKHELLSVLQMTNSTHYEHEHAQGRPLFPPLFRPEAQLGLSLPGNSMPTQRIAWEAALRNKAGELAYLMPIGLLAGLAEMHPVHWLQQHEQLVPCCDYCRGALQEEEDSGSDDGSSGGSSEHVGRTRVIMFTCRDCCVPNYCSSECNQLDKPHHAALCPLLQAVTQRYSRFEPASRQLRASSSSSAAAAAPQRHHAWRVLQLLQPEPGPLGMACQALS